MGCGISFMMNLLFLLSQTYLIGWLLSKLVELINNLFKNIIVIFGGLNAKSALTKILNYKIIFFFPMMKQCRETSKLLTKFRPIGKRN
jgi:hypothetical protein